MLESQRNFRLYTFSGYVAQAVRLTVGPEKISPNTQPMETSSKKLLPLLATCSLLPTGLVWSDVPPTLICPTAAQVECTGGLTPANYDVMAMDAASNATTVIWTVAHSSADQTV